MELFLKKSFRDKQFVAVCFAYDAISHPIKNKLISSSLGVNYANISHDKLRVIIEQIDAGCRVTVLIFKIRLLFTLDGDIRELRKARRLIALIQSFIQLFVRLSKDKYLRHLGTSSV